MSYLKKQVLMNVFTDLQILHRNYLKTYGVSKPTYKFNQQDRGND